LLKLRPIAAAKPHTKRPQFSTASVLHAAMLHGVARNNRIQFTFLA